MSRASATAALLLCSALGVAWAPEARSEARLDYVLHCQGCHLPDGSGKPGAVPDLRGTLGLFLHAAGGREYLIRVPGVAQANLSDARIARVLNWMLATYSPAEIPDDFAPFTADEVARLRRPPLTQVEAVRRELLREAASRD